MEDKKEKEVVVEEVKEVQAEMPCKDDDKACTRRWIESLGDCG